MGVLGAVDPRVLAPGHEFEILNRVVLPVVVSVMNNLSGRQATTNVQFHDSHVFR
jgi:hypothetical protein